MFLLKFVQKSIIISNNFTSDYAGIIITIMDKVSKDVVVPKCKCPPGSERYEDEDGMLIYRSCGGWISPYEMI